MSQPRMAPAHFYPVRLSTVRKAIAVVDALGRS